MIDLTEELVYKALKLAKADQDKIIEKAKEEYDTRTNHYWRDKGTSSKVRNTAGGR